MNSSKENVTTPDYVVECGHLGHEELVAALASPDLRVVLLLRQGAVRAADGDVDGVAGVAGAALACADGRRRAYQQSVPIDGL